MVAAVHDKVNDLLILVNVNLLSFSPPSLYSGSDPSTSKFSSTRRGLQGQLISRQTKYLAVVVKWQRRELGVTRSNGVIADCCRIRGSSFPFARSVKHVCFSLNWPTMKCGT